MTFLQSKHDANLFWVYDDPSSFSIGLIHRQPDNENGEGEYYWQANGEGGFAPTFDMAFEMIRRSA